MKKYLNIFVLFSLLFMASCSVDHHAKTSNYEYDKYTEKTVTFNHVVGTMVIGKHNTQQSKTILMLHGFASSRNEVGDLYKKLAFKLAERGYNTLRIDFRGYGDTKIATAKTSYTTMVIDARNAVKYLRKMGVKNIAVQGFSLGSDVAISAFSHDKSIKNMVLWSTPKTTMAQYYEIKKADRIKAYNKGKVNIDLGWRKITLSKNFFESLKKWNVRLEFAAYKGKSLLIAGGNDPLHRDLKVFKQLNKNAHTITIKHTGHIYGVLNEDTRQSKERVLIHRTVRWFARNFKEPRQRLHKRKHRKHHKKKRGHKTKHGHKHYA